LSKNFYHRIDCRLCSSKDLELVIPLKEIPLTEKYLENKNFKKDSKLYPIDVYMCRTCYHVQILDVIDTDILWNDYTFRSGLVDLIKVHLHDVAERICKKYNIPKKSLVMDIGSNDGTLLQGYKNQNMEVLGIDPAKEIAAEANKSGINTINEFLNEKLSNDIVDKFGKAKVINCFNAFAHADDMVELTKSIKNLMSKDGIFVFEVSYLVDIIEKTLLGTIIHEHLSHHSLLSLEIFLKKFNLELIYVERNPFQGGSIVGVAQFINGPFSVEESVETLIEYERENKFDKLEKIKSFSTKINKINNQLGDLIKKYVIEKKKIAGYGAARSGTTLIAEFNLGDKIQYIFDDHFQKVNKYTPGDLIKVISTKEIVKKMPDYTFILAWVHADKIISDNQEYLNKGGKFILILPEIKIISKDSIYP